MQNGALEAADLAISRADRRKYFDPGLSFLAAWTGPQAQATAPTEPDCCAAAFCPPVRCGAATDLRRESISTSPGAAVLAILMNDDEVHLHFK
jgi:hypothetical protein